MLLQEGRENLIVVVYNLRVKTDRRAIRLTFVVVLIIVKNVCIPSLATWLSWCHKMILSPVFVVLWQVLPVEKRWFGDRWIDGELDGHLIVVWEDSHCVLVADD